MKLVKPDMQNIDRWLKNKGIKYIDIRYELIDHLISEYENLDNYPDLESFLNERLTWCKKVAKRKEKTLHWSYQKEIWIQLFRLLKNAKTILTIVLVALIYYFIYPFLTPKQFKWSLFMPFFSIAAYQIYLLAFKCFNTKKQKEYISIASLVGIFSLPQLFLYAINMFPDTWKINLYFLIPYIGFSMLINFAAILAFHKKREFVVKEYEFLKVYLS